jgi:hypothetical protein
MVENRITMKFADYQVEGHVEYRIIIKDANNETWQVNARYRRLREIHDELKEEFKTEQLPEFPPKKLFGNLDPTFISQRLKALENYFNTLLRKYTLDQLGPVKKFIQEERKSPKADETNTGGDRSDNTNITNANPNPNIQSGRPTQTQDNKHTQDVAIDRIIENYKNNFFDLNDTFNPPDEEEIRKKSHLYQKYVKLDVGIVTSTYKLPTGNESNLIAVQDDTLLAQVPEITHILSKTLDNVDNAIEGIQFLRHIDITAHPEK